MVLFSFLTRVRGCLFQSYVNFLFFFLGGGEICWKSFLCFYSVTGEKRPQQMVLMATARRQNNQILRNPCGKCQQFKRKRKRAGTDPYNCLDLLISWTQTIHFHSSCSVWFFLESWFLNFFEESKREQKENITRFHFRGSLIITKADWLWHLEGLICCFKKKANCNVLMGQAFFILHVTIKAGFVSRSKVVFLCF